MPLPMAGSVKEGASRDPKYDYGEDEELHVLITGDRQEDVCAACTGPCVPVDYSASWLVCQTCFFWVKRALVARDLDSLALVLLPLYASGGRGSRHG